ncbi:hypothetical protein E2C01_031720 [Portunus trituberculatus]|uniref:Uncharacterized protein n=1 Tax=Portunus trituberculatus TaxID=210409 RepID=A0A5B7EXN0_PORTR|nr:hypothetical protein [Portunus trituberculatus]
MNLRTWHKVSVRIYDSDHVHDPSPPYMHRQASTNSAINQEEQVWQVRPHATPCHTSSSSLAEYGTSFPVVNTYINRQFITMTSSETPNMQRVAPLKDITEGVLWGVVSSPIHANRGCSSSGLVQTSKVAL